jgi:enterochelin esterase-like enzyme
VILDNLLADNRTPPLVAVLFDSPDDVRSELGNSPIIAEFVAQELLPWVRRHYHIIANPAHTIVGGLSAGGCAAAYMGLRHPELFGNVLSQSGAFWQWGMERAWVRSLQRALQRLGHDPGPLDGDFGRETVRALRAFQTDKGICVDGNPVGQPTKDAIEAALGEAWQPDIEVEHEWLARQFAASPRLPLRFYLDAGRLEVWPTPDDGPSLRLANRHMRTVLQAKGYPVHYAEFGGGHDWICWQGTLADGLVALLGADRPERTD